MLSILCVAVACKAFEEMGLHLQLHTESRYKVKVTKQITDTQTHKQNLKGVIDYSDNYWSLIPVLLGLQIV